MKLKTIAKAILLPIAIIAAVALLRTTLVTSHQVRVAASTEAVNLEQFSSRLAQAVRFRTISTQEAARGGPEFDRFRAWLEQTYPNVYRTAQKQDTGTPAILLRWQGEDNSLAPILLLAHHDVVPVEAETEAQWKHPPFEAVVDGGTMYARGTLDNKYSLIAILEAANALIARGFRPRRTVYIGSSYDEETAGSGAEAIAALLKQQGVKLEFILDEGAGVTEGMLPGVAAPVAMVGTSEKGYLTLELKVETKGGHSSTPPAESSIGILSAALVKLEFHPMPAHFAGPVRQMLEAAAPEMGFPMKLLFTNLWLTGPLVRWQLAAEPATNATLRTTTALTVFESGNKENVLPNVARALVNFRIAPADSIASVTEHVRSTAGDPRVQIRQVSGMEPAPVSDLDSPGGRLVQSSIRAAFPEALVAPLLFIAATDSHHMIGAARDTYRFSPYRMTDETPSLLHGINERVPLVQGANAIRFYMKVMQGAE